MDQRHLICLLDLDTELSLLTLVDRTDPLAIKAAFLGSALILVNNRNSQQGIVALFPHLDLCKI